MFSVEQAFVGRDEKRAPLKTPAWEAMMWTSCGYLADHKKKYNPEVTQTLKENEKQFELEGNSSYQGINLREIFIKRKKI